MNYFKKFRDELKVIQSGFALFIFFWIVTGLSLLIIAQITIKTWKKYLNENNFFNIEACELNEMKNVFIGSSHIPQVYESKLKIDFDFAEYLSISLSQNLNNAFRFT